MTKRNKATNEARKVFQAAYEPGPNQETAQDFITELYNCGVEAGVIQYQLNAGESGETDTKVHKASSQPANHEAQSEEDIVKQEETSPDGKKEQHWFKRWGWIPTAFLLALFLCPIWLIGLSWMNVIQEEAVPWVTCCWTIIVLTAGALVIRFRLGGKKKKNKKSI